MYDLVTNNERFRVRFNDNIKHRKIFRTPPPLTFSNNKSKSFNMSSMGLANISNRYCYDQRPWLYNAFQNLYRSNLFFNRLKALIKSGQPLCLDFVGKNL